MNGLVRNAALAVCSAWYLLTLVGALGNRNWGLVAFLGVLPAYLVVTLIQRRRQAHPIPAVEAGRAHRKEVHE